MTLDLFSLLSKFRPANDRETDNAYFRTQVPWVAPLAYLHIIFKPAPKDALARAAQRLAMPSPLEEFLARQNGVILFSDTLRIYGVHRPGQLLNREDPFFDLPYNIEEVYHYPPYDPDQFLGFGGYGFDGSTVCVKRSDSRVYFFRRKHGALEAKPSAAWDSIEHWITAEIARLSLLFDNTGKRLVDEALTVPLEGRPN